MILPSVKPIAKTYRNLSDYSWNALIDFQLFLTKDQHSNRYERKVEALHKKLNIPPNFPGINLKLQRYPLNLTSISQGNSKFLMTEKTSAAWLKMRESAKTDGITIHIKWAYRSIEDQAFLIKKHLSWGANINELITWIAPPGYSEHHSGRALDINARSGNDSFEDTDEFRWLSENAKNYGFTMSFPENNKYGMIYEPWHWYYEDE